MTRHEPVLRLEPGTLDAVESEARTRYPEECCGGLLGRVEGQGLRVVVRAVPARNRRTENRDRRYLVDPGDVLRMQEAADAGKLELLGFFHSHPDHPAVPSETDLRHAWPWYSYLIVPVQDGEPGACRSWRLNDAEDAFVEESVEPAGGRGS